MDLGAEPEVPLAQLPPSEPAEEEAAATRKLRGRRSNRIRVDQAISLTNSQLKAFSRDYLQNMEIASKAIQARQALSAAKSLAEKLVLDHGIGGELLNPTLNALFSGRAILGIHRGKKRNRAVSDGEGEGEEEGEEEGEGEEGGGGGGGEAGEGARKRGGGQDGARRTRARTQEQEAGEGGQEVGRAAALDREAPPDLERGGDIGSDLDGVVFLSPGGGISAQPTSSVAGSRFATPSPAQPREPRGVSRMSVAGSVQSVLSGVQELDESILRHGLDDTTDQFEFFRNGRLPPFRLTTRHQYLLIVGAQARMPRPSGCSIPGKKSRINSSSACASNPPPSGVPA